MSDKMFETIFNMKFAAKQLHKDSSKCESEAKALRKKAYQAQKEGSMDKARSYIQSAISVRNAGANRLKLALKLEAVALDLELQNKTIAIGKDMEKTALILSKLLQKTPVERLGGIMSELQECFTKMHVNTDQINSSIGTSGAVMATDAEIEAEMQSIAQEFNLDLNQAMQGPKTSLPNVAAQQQEAAQDDLGARLMALRGK